MENIEEEKLLTLSLAIVTSGDQSNRKRKRREKLTTNQLNPIQAAWEEGKVYRLLEMREKMLKLDYKRKGVIEAAKGLHLIHLLLMSATFVDKNNINMALDNLTELYKFVSLTSDSIQRVVAYFADGLTAKLLTQKSPFFDMITKQPTHEEMFLAFTHLYKASPYYQFAHFTANQAIIEAFENEEEKNERVLHVIDFDVSYGFQWPSLIQSLSEKATKGYRVFLRISGFGSNLEELQETEHRLVSFSKGFRNLAFEFNGYLRNSKNLNFINLKKSPNETLAVNLFFNFTSFNSNSFDISDTLTSLHSLNPSILILVEQQQQQQQKQNLRNPQSFLSKFMESLHYFAAMFDSLDDCLPQDSAERLNIEKSYLGKEIKNMLNHDGYDLDCSKGEKIGCSKGKMEDYKFEGIKLSSKCLIQAKLLLKIRTHYCPLQFDEDHGGGFRVSEIDDGKAISLGWQDRNLLIVSAWQCV